MTASWPVAELGRPIRVVIFGGIYLEPAALRFAAALAEHPEIDFLAAFCQGEGDTLRIRTRDLFRRWGILAVPLMARQGLEGLLHRIASPDETERLLNLRSRVRYVSDLHAPGVLEEVRRLEPDLGLIYGSPILRPELFTIPAFGTLGIHHGKLPEYRGRKTTFWAMYNGERSAGVTIQRIDSGVDTGAIVVAGEVVIGRKSLRRVWNELQLLGVRLYVDAVLTVKHGRAALSPQEVGPRGRSGLYRQPRLNDTIRFAWRRFATRVLGPDARE